MAKTKKAKENDQTKADLSANDLLRAKLIKKYHLLKADDLDTDDREELLERVCRITGMYRNQLDVVLQDL